jgi:hypothetical protein
MALIFRVLTLARPSVNNNQRIVVGASLGLNTLAVFQILGLSNLDNSLTLAIYCFAFSTPALAAYLGVLMDGEVGRIRERVGILAVLGGIASFIGLTAIFFHMTVGAGLVFLATTGLVSFLLKPRHTHRGSSI